MRVEKIGGATLYLADNKDVMLTLTRPAALIGDPPYGQRQNTNVVKKGGIRTFGDMGGREGPTAVSARVGLRNSVMRGTGMATVWPNEIAGDGAPFNADPWLIAADIVLLWGAHKFADRLPSGSWLVWDKVPTGKIRDQGDGEAAWLNSNPPRPLRIFRLLWDGVCVGSAARHEVTAGQSRVHPTQKPEALMAWCVQQARVPVGGVILDPWMGAGSTGMAAIRAGYPFVGIEVEPRYFDAACARIERTHREIVETARQGGLFTVTDPASDPYDRGMAELFEEPET